jgi:hypothetical protein
MTVLSKYIGGDELSIRLEFLNPDFSLNPLAKHGSIRNAALVCLLHLTNPERKEEMESQRFFSV